MKRVMLAMLVVILAGIAVAASTSYTITPWPYGVVAWVQGEPNSAEIQDVEKAVQDVFSFWHQPLPESADTWNDLQEMEKGSWAASDYDPFTAGFLPIPSANASQMWAVPLSSWNGQKILPLTLIAVPTPSQLQSLAGMPVLAAFSPKNMPNNALSLNRDPSLAMLTTRSDSVIFDYNSRFLGYVLDHELTHWLTTLICQREGVSIQNVPHLLQEGFAEYTAFRLSGANRNWRISASVWAEGNRGLSDVPLFMWYPIGTSFVSFLVERDGIDGFIGNFPDLVANWDKIISDLTPAWQAWARKYKVNEAERAYAEMDIEQLMLCKVILQPIITDDALSMLGRVSSRKGSMEDIDRFWEIISAPVPKPTADVWKKLHRLTFNIVQVASGYSDFEMEKLATDNGIKLSRFFGKGDWDGYHALLIETLREVVAHYGLQEVIDTTQQTK